MSSFKNYAIAYVFPLMLIYVAYQVFGFFLFGVYKALNEDFERTTAAVGALMAFFILRFLVSMSMRLMDVGLCQIKANRTGNPASHMFDEGCEFPDDDSIWCDGCNLLKKTCKCPKYESIYT